MYALVCDDEVFKVCACMCKCYYSNVELTLYTLANEPLPMVSRTLKSLNDIVFIVAVNIYYLYVTVLSTSSISSSMSYVGTIVM